MVQRLLQIMNDRINKNNLQLAVIGLGYVGLPLAVEFGKSRSVIGFDVNKNRIHELIKGHDHTLETTPDELKEAFGLSFTYELNDIAKCNCFIVTVPTPIDINKKPDLTPLLLASKSIGEVLKKEDIVIYESTVYPGATEDECVPVLEKYSGLKFNKDFFCGYSPERINPGDKEHRVSNIKKITSGSNPYVADIVDNLYNEIVKVGTHKAESIKVAEAAKVIENTQRDINIALVNELAVIFNIMDIDTEAVLKAAGTKWNFLPFRPGLVGGHCIGVDPYYLTHKAQEVGYDARVILSGRRLNDSMGSYVAGKLLREIDSRNFNSKNIKVLIMGIAFKENCPDIRNTKVIDIVKTLLKKTTISVDVYDPLIDPDECRKEFDINPKEVLENNYYNAIILAVAHDSFKLLGEKSLRKLLKDNGIIYDLKYLLSTDESDMRL